LATAAQALDTACFHAQQAVEKCLKAFLAHRNVEFPYTHNLAKLIEICAGLDPAFRSLLPAVAPLTPYAVELRYDDSFWHSESIQPPPAKAWAGFAGPVMPKR
jgi:HEPN domain-containing protein